MTVATALAVSWKPLTNSNDRAMPREDSRRNTVYPSSPVTESMDMMLPCGATTEGPRRLRIIRALRGKAGPPHRLVHDPPRCIDPPMALTFR